MSSAHLSTQSSLRRECYNPLSTCIFFAISNRFTQIKSAWQHRYTSPQHWATVEGTIAKQDNYIHKLKVVNCRQQFPKSPLRPMHIFPHKWEQCRPLNFAPKNKLVWPPEEYFIFTVNQTHTFLGGNKYQQNKFKSIICIKNTLPMSMI